MTVMATEPATDSAKAPDSVTAMVREPVTGSAMDSATVTDSATATVKEREMGSVPVGHRGCQEGKRGRPAMGR